MPGALYTVATPIGNLEDMTLRAIRILKEVDVIAAEDTRHSQVLLNHFDIHMPLTSYHEHNEKGKAQQLVARMARGENVALISDAGTPVISDPGYRLITEALGAGIRVIPIPGPSAVIAVLGASGLATEEFVFGGFLPAKKQSRRLRLQQLRSEHRSTVFYEAPHRLIEFLDDLYAVVGDRRVVLAREVTKIHEQFIRGRVSEVIQQVAACEIRGEITLVIEGGSEANSPSEDTLREEIAKLQRDGMRIKEIAEVLGEKYDYAKKEIYRLALERSR
jgi:16S rRNA (cytidine1402-2'-O)-methyltransferase